MQTWLTEMLNICCKIRISLEQLSINATYVLLYVLNIKRITCWQDVSYNNTIDFPVHAINKAFLCFYNLADCFPTIHCTAKSKTEYRAASFFLYLAPHQHICHEPLQLSLLIVTVLYNISLVD